MPSSSSIEDHILDLACHVHNVCVDSRARDTTAYPHPWAYVVPLTDVLQNVLDVELVYAQYSVDSASADLLPNYVILAVEECAPNNFAATTPALSGAFTILPASSATVEYTHEKYRSVKRFAVPKAKLSRLTLSFFASDGRPLTTLGEHLLRFEVRTAPHLSLAGQERRQINEQLHVVLPKLNRRLRALEAALARAAADAAVDHPATLPATPSSATSSSTTSMALIKRTALLAAVTGAAGYAGYRVYRRFVGHA